MVASRALGNLRYLIRSDGKTWGRLAAFVGAAHGRVR
jgi:hypothetical protein